MRKEENCRLSQEKVLSGIQAVLAQSAEKEKRKTKVIETFERVISLDKPGDGLMEDLEFIVLHADVLESEYFDANFFDHLNRKLNELALRPPVKSRRRLL